MGVFVILKISPCPSFPKRGIERRSFTKEARRVSTEKSEKLKIILTFGFRLLSS
jgi:hypothetical protein